MPVVLYVLACAVFAQSTSEFMLAGLVGDIARDLSVSLSAAGALTSAFAVGMVVGAPLAAVLARRVAPRAALTGFLAVFVVVHVVGALTPGFAVLVGTRLVAALANAGFLAVALAAASRIAPPGRTGRATAILLSGTTLACIAGVPLGALLGQWLGWRAAFWAVALVCLPAVAGVARGVVVSVPTGVGRAGPAPVAPELRVLRRPVLVAVLLVGVLVNAGTFGAYTYLGPLVVGAVGLARGWVAVSLAAFGLGAFLGVVAAGRLADARPRSVLLGGGGALIATWAGLAVVTAPVALLVLIVLAGALAFGVGSTVVARSLVLAGDAPTLRGSFATVALNAGAVVGPSAAGASLAAVGARGPVGVAAVLAALAAVPVGLVVAARRE